MCGIAGTYDDPIAEPEFRAMIGALAHRGPDAAGLARAMAPVPIWLGHRRLSIIDVTDAANQPFEKHGLVLVYNGELYNYRELRRELEARGAGFATRSDTEVLLEAWRYWGPAALARFRGMFAFAVYDRASGRLVLARDHFGIKPLFFTRAGSRIAFASELRALARLPGFRRAIDDAALAALLLYDWIPEDQSIYRGVEKLAPGCYATIDPGGSFEVHRYWDPVAAFGARASGPEPALASVLEDSVRAHLVADVEIGAFLSGGLDSSLLVAMASRYNPSIRCYTIGFRPVDQQLEAMPDDLRYARQLATQLGVPLEEIEMSPDVAGLLPSFVSVLDEPIGDAAALNVLAMCSAARASGIKVLLSGMGADEIFSGYRRHRACLLGNAYRRIPSLGRRAIETVVDRLPVASRTRGLVVARWAKRFVALARHEEEAAYRRSYTYYDPEELDELLAGRGAAHVAELCRRHACTYWAAGRTRGRDAQLARMCLTDLQMFLPALNLAYTDRASMAASVEVRVPFVDRDVVAAAFGLRARERIRGRVQKVALKQVAERWLPHEIVHRPKSSFGLPLRAWMARDLRGELDASLPDGALVSRGYLDGAVIRRMIDHHASGRADHAQALWQLLAVEHWVRAHVA
ncbi:MAG TPA: asparagine synthase (glutamine-hydrolyzing) [Kofleriaceae bacterium]|nr:asparagine synthase (glutamine-hydrolyzing) [Kofleriaceae bacterium]